jgi:hypothetical protein
MDEDILSEIESRRIEFKTNIHEFMQKHSLINKCRDIKVMEGKKSNKSVLDLYGVRFVAGDKHYFFCLLGQCFHKRQIIGINKGSTGNATLHLSAMHNIVAGKTLAHQCNVEKLATYIEAANKHFTEDPHHWFQVNISAFACEQSLSYNVFNSSIWKVIANKLPVGNRTLTSFNVRKHYVEHYLRMKKMITGSIREAKQVYTIPFLSVSLDLIQNTVQNKKLIGLRVSYIRGQDMKSWIQSHGARGTRRQSVSTFN